MPGQSGQTFQTNTFQPGHNLATPWPKLARPGQTLAKRGQKPSKPGQNSQGGGRASSRAPYCIYTRTPNFPRFKTRNLGQTPSRFCGHRSAFRRGLDETADETDPQKPPLDETEDETDAQNPSLDETV